MTQKRSVASQTLVRTRKTQFYKVQSEKVEIGLEVPKNSTTSMIRTCDLEIKMLGDRPNAQYADLGKQNTKKRIFN